MCPHASLNCKYLSSSRKLDPRYYFDLRDNDELAVDGEGVELATLQAVQIEAARSLVDMARHAIWTKAESLLRHRMAIEVRDENGAVLQAKFTFELERTSSSAGGGATIPASTVVAISAQLPRRV